MHAYRQLDEPKKKTTNYMINKNKKKSNPAKFMIIMVDGLISFNSHAHTKAIDEKKFSRKK